MLLLVTRAYLMAANFASSGFKMWTFCPALFKLVLQTGLRGEKGLLVTRTASNREDPSISKRLQGASLCRVHTGKWTTVGWMIWLPSGCLGPSCRLAKVSPPLSVYPACWLSISIWGESCRARGGSLLLQYYNRQSTLRWSVASQHKMCLIPD